MNTAREQSTLLANLLRREHAALGEFLVALADFDRRRSWAELGYASLFWFLHRELGLSKGAAQYRKSAAELIQQVPAAVAPLRDGRLCLTSVIEAARVVTPENWEAVLPRFYGLSKREAMEVVARLQPDPAPPSRTLVTALLPARAASGEGAAGKEDDAAPPPHPGATEPQALPPSRGRPDEPTSAPESSPQRSPGTGGEALGAVGRVVDLAGAAAVEPAASIPIALPPRLRDHDVVPLTAEKSRLHVTVSSRFLAKLEAVKAALSHSHPRATAEDLLEAGLDLLLQRAAKRKGLVERPRKAGPASSKADRVPAHVKREVWKRDGGRCQWPVASGGICGSTTRVELDHSLPRARGGPPTVANLRLLCRFHNDHAAREFFGNAWMDRFTNRGRRRDRPPAAG